MAQKYDTLIMGASYGSLLAIKLLFGGHTVKLVCLPEEANLINSEGARVRFAVDTDRLDAVVRALADAGVRSLQAHPPTLEQLFLRHYEADAPRPGT